MTDKLRIDLAAPDPPDVRHFDQADYGGGEDENGFRDLVRDALVPIKQLLDDCEEIWSPVEQGIPYVRAMAIAVQELNKVSSNAAGRVLVYTGWQRFEEVDNDPNDCPECSRSFGPHYTGPCEH